MAAVMNKLIALDAGNGVLAIAPSACIDVRVLAQSVAETFTLPKKTIEVSDITAAADIAGSLSGTSFIFNSANDETGYYVWYDVTGEGSVDPAIADRTGVKVTITSGATANAVASATRTALLALSDFVITGATSHIIITNATYGFTTDTADVDTSFTFSTTTQGGQLARFVKLSSSDTFYADFTTTAAAPGDVTDGTAATLNPTNVYFVGDLTAISVITPAAGGAVVTASYYR